MGDRLLRRLGSPLGDLVLVADGDTLLEIRLPGVMVALAGGHDVHDGLNVPDPAADEILSRAADQLEAYFAGELRAFDLPVLLRGTPFQQQVWRALLDIPFGATVSYAQLAAAIGRPGAARAVGRAVGQNPIAVVVPCHRVVGADGGLTGYAGGLPAKQQLLRLERRQTTD